jgi:hypothetical protein
VVDDGNLTYFIIRYRRRSLLRASMPRRQPYRHKTNGDPFLQTTKSLITAGEKMPQLLWEEQTLDAPAEVTMPTFHKTMRQGKKTQTTNTESNLVGLTTTLGQTPSMFKTLRAASLTSIAPARFVIHRYHLLGPPSDIVPLALELQCRTT